MTLAERIQALLREIEKGLVERENILRLAFLAIITQQPTYLYGRAGAGKRPVIRHLIAGFRDLGIQTYGRRNFDLPSAEKPADIAVFTSFDSSFAPMLDAIRAILDEHLSGELLLSGRMRPDAALSEAGLADSIHLVLTFPDTISPDALKELLSPAGDPDKFTITDNLRISHEELSFWSREIEKVSISADSLAILRQIAAECESDNIYISARKWRGLAQMARAQAFFAGRTETNVTDFLFLSEDLWGKRATNEAIRKGFQNGLEVFLDSYAPNPEEVQKQAQELLLQAEHFRNSTGKRYKTTLIDDKEYITYSITVFNEPITLYAPLSRVGTSEDFHPLNILHREELRAKCNYMSGDICKISIDSRAKKNGMRASSSMMTNGYSPAQGTATFEDYAKLPTEILQMNDPEIRAQNQTGLQEAHEKILELLNKTVQSLKQLKSLYTRNSEFQSDPFLTMGAYKKFMDFILKRYKSLGDFSKKLQEYETALSKSTAAR